MSESGSAESEQPLDEPPVIASLQPAQDDPAVEDPSGAGESTEAEEVGVGDGVFRRLDPRYVPADRLSSWIFTAVVAFVAGFVSVLLIALQVITGWWILLDVVAVGLVVGLLAWVSHSYPRWHYEHVQYAVSPLGIEIHSGIVWRRVINVPRSRIQHTDVVQGPIARRFGVATLNVYTAGTEHNSVGLEGLAHETALEIRNYLVNRASSDDV